MTASTIQRETPAVSFGYSSALDGFRAWGALPVMACHCGVPFMPSGFLSVDLFFVLSGFLITRLLLREVEKTGTLSLTKFYFRRTLRLLPALLTVCLTFAVGCVLLRGWSETLNELVPALTYTSDLTRRGGWPRWLGHTWSLSLEEQFYIVWPILIVPLLDFFSRKHLGLLLLVLAAGVALWRFFLFHHGVHWSRSFDFPDVHSDGIMLGCALAFSTAETMRKVARVWVPSLIGLIAMMVFVPSYLSPFHYNGGFSLSALFSASMIAKIVTDEGSAFGAALSARWMVWVGQISYGVYLWHIVVLSFLPEMKWQWIALIVFVVTLTLSGLMRVAIELPALDLKNRALPRKLQAVLTFGVPVCMACGVTLVLLGIVPPYK